MKVLLASYAPRQAIGVWGTSNYILHVPRVGTHKRTIQTPNVGGGIEDYDVANKIYTPHPKQLKVDTIKSNVAKGLAGKLKSRGVGKGMAVI